MLQDVVLVLLRMRLAQDDEQVTAGQRAGRTHYPSGQARGSATAIGIRAGRVQGCPSANLRGRQRAGPRIGGSIIVGIPGLGLGLSAARLLLILLLLPRRRWIASSCPPLARVSWAAITAAPSAAPPTPAPVVVVVAFG